MRTDGVLVVDKPAGPTSFDVVQRVRRLLGAEKAGHTGTLDPAATGVLAVCVGEAVKLQRFLAEGDKSYQATVAFGAATDTEDAEGTIVERGDASALESAAVAGVLPRFLGAIAQTPPMYSAVRVSGRRLHEAARAGESVERAPRTVAIHALELLSFERAPDGLVRVRLAVRCGKGTYVRTLAADLGRALSVPAHLAALRRTATGPFDLSRALTLEVADALAQAGRLEERLVPPEEALDFLPAARLSAAQAREVVHGRALPFAGVPPGLACALDPDGRLLAVCASDGRALRPVRVFAPPTTGASAGKN